MSLGDRLRAQARALRAQAEVLDAEADSIERGPEKAEHYTSATWPGGARNFRSLIRAGKLAATRVGRDLLVRRDDGDAILTPTLRAPATRPKPANDDSDEAIAARLRARGIRVAGGAK